MTQRRDLLLDAAIEILGEQGMRALTHRAVDASAGVPAGSTANYFPTRDELLEGVVDRFAERERAHWDELAPALAPMSAAELAQALASIAHDVTGPIRSLTLARYAVLLEAATRPAIRARLAETGSRVMAHHLQWMRMAGSRDSERDTAIVANYWTGLVLHQLSYPKPDFDPLGPLTALLEALIPRRRR